MFIMYNYLLRIRTSGDVGTLSCASILKHRTFSKSVCLFNASVAFSCIDTLEVFKKDISDTKALKKLRLWTFIAALHYVKSS